MEKKLDNEEIVIDVNKISKIICYRKKIIICCFALIMVLTAVLTFLLPKKYESSAKILINKANSTNLAEINPFVISDPSSLASSGMASILGQQEGLSDEIQILESSLVLEPVIIENNLKYKSGWKKGKHLSVEDFLKKNISIKNLKGSKVVDISYMSKDPKLSYNVVYSIIKNYKSIYEKINSNKALKDREFLEKRYLDAQKSVNEKIAEIKIYERNTKSVEDEGFNAVGILALYDKRIGKDINSITQRTITLKKLQSELDIETEKLKELKIKYEWSNLVENMSKNATNITLLKEPEIRNNFDFSEPRLAVNTFIGLLLSSILSIIMLLNFEKRDKKLTYSDIDDKTTIFNNEFNITNIKTEIILNNIKQISLLSFDTMPTTLQYKNIFDKEFKNDINLDVLTDNNLSAEMISKIKQAESVIILAKIGYSDKKIFNKIKTLCEDLNKNILEIVFTA